ncbi:DUF1310 family protein [Alloscardovia venturai]|uniref:DUF1310 family protein n=1 Tax=Alloscardovia venturai TaxID=1769421 RepID=A0ABW2Y8F8_9BIFI
MVKRRRKRHIVLAVFLSIVLLVVLGVILQPKIEHLEMVHEVNTPECQKAIKEMLLEHDKKALTPQGKIKTYKIDYNSLSHSPMGGIYIDVIINDDPNIAISSIFSDHGHGIHHEIVLPTDGFVKLVGGEGFVND